MSEQERLMRQRETAQRLQRLLHEAGIDAAFDDLRERYVAAMLTTTGEDDDQRRRLWQAVQVLDQVRAHLAAVLADGRLADRQLDDLAAGRRPFF